MVTFPTLMYRIPGEHTGGGYTYDILAVQNLTEHAAAVGNGWFDSMPEAIDNIGQNNTVTINDVETVNTKKTIGVDIHYPAPPSKPPKPPKPPKVK